MEVLLRQDLDSLGYEGDKVKVANGYARNYLIPNGIAVQATKQNIKMMEMQKKKIEIRRLKAKEDAEKVKDEINDTVVVKTQKAGKEGRLYGSVTSMDIAAMLEKEGITIDRRKILLEGPIKATGEYEVKIRIYPEVIASVKVVIEPEPDEAGEK